jgi:hypothetical protein
VVRYPSLQLLFIDVGVDNLLACQQNPIIASSSHIGFPLLDLRFKIGDGAIKPLEFLRKGRTSQIVGGLPRPVK